PLCRTNLHSCRKNVWPLSKKGNHRRRFRCRYRHLRPRKRAHIRRRCRAHERRLLLLRGMEGQRQGRDRHPARTRYHRERHAHRQPRRRSIPQTRRVRKGLGFTTWAPALRTKHKKGHGLLDPCLLYDLLVISAALQRTEVPRQDNILERHFVLCKIDHRSFAFCVTAPAKVSAIREVALYAIIPHIAPT